MPNLSLPPSLWETAKCDFKALFPEDVFQMWFEPLVCLETSEDSITLGVPNDFAAIWIHDNYLDLITQRLRLTAGRLVNVTPQEDRRGHRPHQPHRPRLAPGRTRPQGPRRRQTRSALRRPWRRRRFAQPAQHVRDLRRRLQQPDGPRRRPRRRPGPRAGLQPPLPLRRDRPRQDPPDARHRARHPPANPDARVAYLSTEKFTNEFIQALQDNASPSSASATARRCPADRRRAVPRRQGAHPGRVLPHLQRPLRVR
jgi:chromosomal replication initiator protein